MIEWIQRYRRSNWRRVLLKEISEYKKLNNEGLIKRFLNKSNIVSHYQIEWGRGSGNCTLVLTSDGYEANGYGHSFKDSVRDALAQAYWRKRPRIGDKT